MAPCPTIDDIIILDQISMPPDSPPRIPDGMLFSAADMKNAVLEQKFDSLIRHMEYRFNQTDKKLDEVIGKFCTKEELKAVEMRAEEAHEALEELHTSFRWYWRTIIGAIIGAVVVASLAYIGISSSGFTFHH